MCTFRISLLSYFVLNGFEKKKTAEEILVSLNSVAALAGWKSGGTRRASRLVN